MTAHRAHLGKLCGVPGTCALVMRLARTRGVRVGALGRLRFDAGRVFAPGPAGLGASDCRAALTAA